MEEDSDHSLISRFRDILRKKIHLSKDSDLTEEIHDLMNEGQAKGLISGEETNMVHGVLDLKETNAHSIMIPRTEISSASINSTLGEVIRLVSDCGHTRIPICKDSIDEIEGILHAKDILKLWGDDPESKIPSQILREPYFVPGNLKVSELLEDLKEKKTHLAIVTDEYGGTEGIITIEDILEEIVGEILDEHDNDQPMWTKLDEHSIIVDARLEVEKLEEHLGIKLPEGDFESVGGFIIHLLGRIPKAGESVSYKNMEIIIKSAGARKIDKILLTYQPPSDPASREKEHR